MPEKYQGNTVEFGAAMEGLEVHPDTLAKVVLNERTGTIVIGNVSSFHGGRRPWQSDPDD